jgi:hypothetical protein
MTKAVMQPWPWYVAGPLIGQGMAPPTQANHVKTLFILLGTLAAPMSVAAQEAPPSDFAELEIERSRECVGVLQRLQNLNLALEPLGQRSERVLALLQAIALEDRTLMESLDLSDATESAIYDWFLADGRLAQSFVDTGNQALQQQRTINREQIRGRVQAQGEEVQAEAQMIIEAAGDLGTRTNLCEGAILIRPTVLEACETEESPVCDAAADTIATPGYAFVDSPGDLWGVEELRPWSQPGALQIEPDGTLSGAMTVALARIGNVVLTVAFSPLIMERSALSEDATADFQQILDSLGFEFDHPDFIYAPSLAVRATLPEPLAGEDSYILYFGEPDSVDLIWEGPAATGEMLDGTFLLSARHVLRLQAGELIRFTAIKSVENEDPEGPFTVEVTTVNQVPTTRALLAYMANQLAADLNRLRPPRGG